VNGRSIARKNNPNCNLWGYTIAQFPKEENGFIYIRQSSMAQVQTNIHSFEMQTDKFLEYFRNRGCTGHIEIIADDEGMSGTKDIHEMPGLSRVMRLIEGKELLNGKKVGWGGAVHVNRFTRDKWLVKPGTIMKACYQNDVWLATLRMDFNFKDDYCQRVFMLEAEEAARHLEWMKLVLGGARSAASDKGYYDGRMIVPGYIIDRSDPQRKKYIVYEPHARIVRWLFRRFLELDGNFGLLKREVEALPYVFPKFEDHVDPKTVSKFSLNRKKFQTVTPEGHYKVFRHGLENILTNPVYIGWWIPLDGGVIKDNHDAIIDEELFVYAHKRIATHTLEGERQKPERVVRYSKAEALLSKVLQDVDGTPLYSNSANRVYRCLDQKQRVAYTTRFEISIDIIDTAFSAKFFERLKSWQGCEEWTDTFFEQRAEREQVRREQESLIKQQIAEAESRLVEITNTATMPGCPASLKEKLFRDYEGVEEKKKSLGKNLVPDKSSEEEDDEILFEIHTLLPEIIETWDDISFEKRIRFISALVKKVTLTPGSPGWMQMEIYWKRTDWANDFAHIKRPHVNGNRWTPGESDILMNMYRTADAVDILRALPTRCWQAIILRAAEMGIQRERNYQKNSLPVSGSLYRTTSLRDIEYMEQHGIPLGTKGVVWSS
jgi:hypothetical protein